ncbi:MAG: lipoate protein ligase C-terminal domain-containing protein [Eubacteriales bacterium]|nr:lipoate protein ligase C-terminal domain-containing protein [Eubacteriales bacterium]
MIRRTACLIARGNNPYRNLAIEKHLMDTLPENTAVLYLSQNRHTIIVGRNQNPWHECKVDSFLESGGSIARRVSGGGVSYQDMGALNFSLIVPKTDFDIPRQLAMLASAVSSLNITAQIGLKSCLMAGGRVFGSNAFYKSGSAAIHHGTLLFQTTMDVMEHYLKPRNKQPMTPEDPPLRARMVNLQELNPSLTLQSLEQSVCRTFASAFRAEPAWLDERILDSGTIDGLCSQFENPGWIYPENVNYDFSVEERFPWGSVTILLLRENGLIRAAKLFSDAMEAALFLRIEQSLIGCPFLIGAITTRFEQKLELLRDTRLLQIAGDVCTLLCGRIRAMDRDGGKES